MTARLNQDGKNPVTDEIILLKYIRPVITFIIKKKQKYTGTYAVEFIKRIFFEYDYKQNYKQPQKFSYYHSLSLGDNSRICIRKDSTPLDSRTIPIDEKT